MENGKRLWTFGHWFLNSVKRKKNIPISVRYLRNREFSVLDVPIPAKAT